MNEKKKLMALAALAIVIVAVGAFQFMKPGPTPPPAPKPKEQVAAKADTGAPTIMNPSVANQLPQRDPFHPDTLPPIQTPPVQQPEPKPQPEQPRRNPMGKPIKPLFGIDTSGALPGTIYGKPGVEVAPVTPPEPVFGYKVAGVMVGPKSIAIFVDSQGAQRMIPQGGSLDADTRIVSVQRGRVTVVFHGKTLTLSPGGNPNEK